MVYYFDHYEYKSARKDPAKVTRTETVTVAKAEPLEEPPVETLVATSQEGAVAAPVISALVKPVLTREEAVELLTKEEKREFKRDLKKEIKKLKKDPDPVGGDLGWAAIFTVFGSVLLITGSVA